MKKCIALILCLGLLLALFPAFAEEPEGRSCTTILVGKDATHDGSTLIARNDDGSYDPKYLTVTEADGLGESYTGVASHLTLTLPEHSLRFTSIPNANPKQGIWASGGINEANVAMTATETITSNPRVLAADPYVVRDWTEDGEETPGGLGEEDVVTLVLPFIRSAREGVLRMGALLEQYGTYEANGMAFSDRDEVWWLETIGGHHWIARRVPDDRVVIMPNQFGLDHFDFADALGEGKDCLCSADLPEFVEKNRLYTGQDGESFNPRLAFGSHDDIDHLYNTPRAWYMARYFLGNSYRWDGADADFTPASDNLPWSFVPERKVTVQDVRYLLSSHYQGTPYDPYNKQSGDCGRYRGIGVPNSDDSFIFQIRGWMPEALQGVEWVTLGGACFTASFPLYASVSRMPDYVGATTATPDTAYLYWQSRMIAALTDANYDSAFLGNLNYLNTVCNEGYRLLAEYDAKAAENADEALLEEANQTMTDFVKARSDEVLNELLRLGSDSMTIRYHFNKY